MSDLSSHLMQKNLPGHEQRIAEKMQSCVWEHVHAAHRFARTGNAETAKLHADLATHAMKMLSHYLPAEEYHGFLSGISSQLQSLRSGSLPETGAVSNTH